jgi:hypothetical protein
VQGAPLDEDAFLAETEKIIRAAEARGVPLRACGGVGFYLRIRTHPGARELYLHRDGGRALQPRFKDLDLAGFERHSRQIYRLLVRELGFTEDRETNALFGSYRNVYFHPQFQIDIFYDVLRFNHNVPLKGRLGPGLALAPEDLLLSKLQIHETTARDLADLAAGALAFPAASVDRAYLAGVLGDDWGFWYEADQNLRKTAGFLAGLRTPDGANHPHSTLALLRVREYLDFLEGIPKTRRWEKRRARGTAESWFEPVDELR